MAYKRWKKKKKKPRKVSKINSYRARVCVFGPRIVCSLPKCVTTYRINKPYLSSPSSFLIYGSTMSHGPYVSPSFPPLPLLIEKRKTESLPHVHVQRRRKNITRKMKS